MFAKCLSNGVIRDVFTIISVYLKFNFDYVQQRNGE